MDIQCQKWKDYETFNNNYLHALPDVQMDQNSTYIKSDSKYFE